ncbi:hypothetical protein BD626DRAFT_568066 [Schizophyllum amplum]|uniref:Uncharacterized protein n=1 Tax=Schizophyllum amplum TaxID=97359 RepID=A0A550CHM1_9AGAR|nr:hypothetical protein BD626DRAFT_568066 [Auriculariopsis ampla]
MQLITLPNLSIFLYFMKVLNDFVTGAQSLFEIVFNHLVLALVYLVLDILTITIVLLAPRFMARYLPNIVARFSGCPPPASPPNRDQPEIQNATSSNDAERDRVSEARDRELAEALRQLAEQKKSSEALAKENHRLRTQLNLTNAIHDQKAVAMKAKNAQEVAKLKTQHARELDAKDGKIHVLKQKRAATQTRLVEQAARAAAAEAIVTKQNSLIPALEIVIRMHNGTIAMRDQTIATLQQENAQYQRRNAWSERRRNDLFAEVQDLRAERDQRAEATIVAHRIAPLSGNDEADFYDQPGPDL